MSRETLLDEAIAKAKECEDWQLVEWLRMARGGESAARWYSDKLREAHRTERKLQAENAKLRELVVALYHIHFGTEEESWDAWEDFCPCTICEERHGGEAPCAYTAKDLADECCEPITKEIVIDRMRELGVEV